MKYFNYANANIEYVRIVAWQFRQKAALVTGSITAARRSLSCCALSFLPPMMLQRLLSLEHAQQPKHVG
ncbi:unnamed protein product, partial [Ixodes pacificus]